MRAPRDVLNVTSPSTFTSIERGPAGSIPRCTGQATDGPRRPLSLLTCLVCGHSCFLQVADRCCSLSSKVSVKVVVPVSISDSKRSSSRRALTSPAVLALIRPLCNVLADVLLAHLQRRVCL